MRLVLDADRDMCYLPNTNEGVLSLIGEGEDDIDEDGENSAFSH